MTFYSEQEEVVPGKSRKAITANFENLNSKIVQHCANYVPGSTTELSNRHCGNHRSSVSLILERCLPMSTDKYLSSRWWGWCSRPSSTLPPLLVTSRHTASSDNPGSDSVSLHHRHRHNIAATLDNWSKREGNLSLLPAGCVQLSGRSTCDHIQSKVQSHFHLIDNQQCDVCVGTGGHCNKHRNASRSSSAYFQHKSYTFPLNSHRIIPTTTTLVSLIFLLQILFYLNSPVANCQSIHNYHPHHHRNHEPQQHFSQQKPESRSRIIKTSQEEQGLFGTKLKSSANSNVDNSFLSLSLPIIESHQLTKHDEYLLNKTLKVANHDEKHDIEPGKAPMPANLRQFSNLNEDLVFEDSTDVETSHYEHNDNGNYISSDGNETVSSLDYENIIPSDSNHFNTNQDNMVFLKFNQSEPPQQFIAPSVAMQPQSIVTSNQLKLQIHHGDGSFSQIERAPLGLPPMNNGQIHPATDLLVHRYHQVSNSIHSFDPHSPSGYPNFKPNIFDSNNNNQYQQEDRHSADQPQNNGMQFNSDLAPDVQFKPSIDNSNYNTNNIRDILPNHNRPFNHDRVERVDSGNNQQTEINTSNDANNYNHNEQDNMVDNKNRQFANAMKAILNNHRFLRRKATLDQNQQGVVGSGPTEPNQSNQPPNRFHEAGDHILRPFLRNKDFSKVRHQASATSNQTPPQNMNRKKHRNDFREDTDWAKIPMIELKRIRDNSRPLNNNVPKIFNKRMPLLSNDEGFILPNVSERNREIAIDKRADFDGDIQIRNINNKHHPNGGSFRRRFGDFVHDTKANHILNNEQNSQPPPHINNNNNPNFDNSFRMGEWVDEISMNDLDLDDIPPNQLPPMARNNRNNNNNNFQRQKHPIQLKPPNQRNLKPSFDGHPGQSTPPPPPPIPPSQMMPLFFDKFLSDFMNINPNPAVSQDGFTIPPPHSQVSNQRNFGPQDPVPHPNGPPGLTPNDIGDLDGPNHVERRINTGNHLPPSPKLKPEKPAPNDYTNEILPPNEFENDFNIWPKIFRFTDGRINLHEFEREKKRSRIKFSHKMSKTQSLYNIKRDSFLILHGGTFSQ